MLIKASLKQWRYFLLAIGFFTRIPMPTHANFQEHDLNHATKYFPLVGILVGLVAAIFFYCALFIFPQVIAVLISMASTIYLTGAFHEDGLADSADGLGGGWSQEQMLSIMQDSRLGTYGAVALFGMLLVKFQTLNTLPTISIPFILIVGHSLSRLSAVWLMASADYVRSVGKNKPIATQISASHLLLANGIGFLPFLSLLIIIFNHYSLSTMIELILIISIPLGIVWFWWRAKLLKNIHGYTGDTLGAMQQITELTFYLSMLAFTLRVGGMQ